jgi:hypothetical protein
MKRFVEQWLREYPDPYPQRHESNVLKVAIAAHHVPRSEP